MTALRIAVELPREFPAKYRGAIERAIDHCAVKNQLMNPPRFELHLSGGDGHEEAEHLVTR